MGVSAFEMLEEQLGHKKLAKFVPTVNSKGKGDTAKGPAKASPQSSPPKAAAPPKPTMTDFEKKKKQNEIASMAENAIYSRFTDMYKAFQYVDLDRSGRLSRDEISRALDLWNVPIDDDTLDLLLSKCDQDSDGGISYEEFVDALCRETVAPAAMGKRGMQSEEAMGVSAFEMLEEQLGHKKLAKFKPTVNSK
jgi:hypothetical protein